MNAHPTESHWKEKDFEIASGIGIRVTESEIQDIVRRHIDSHKEEIERERYQALSVALKEISTHPLTKWADPKLRMKIVQKQFEELLGPKDERDSVKKAVFDHLFHC
jgi:glutaminyl-tRNA synthetase